MSCCIVGIVNYYRYCPVGRSFYSPNLGRRQQLGEGLESWRGFYQSIRPTQMGLSLNIGSVKFFFRFLFVKYILAWSTHEPHRLSDQINYCFSFST